MAKSLDLEKSSSERVSIAAASVGSLDLNGLDGITLEGWVRFEALSGTNVLLSKYSYAGGGGKQYGVWFVNSSGWKTRFRVVCGGTEMAAQWAWTPTVEVWYHVALVLDTTQAASANRARFYVDSVDQGTVTYTSGTPTRFDTISTETLSDFVIGGFGNPADFFDGEIFRPRVWRRALTATEIANNYLVATPPVTTSLEGQWDFADVLTDASGNGHTVTHSGTATYNTDVPYTDGIFGEGTADGAATTTAAATTTLAGAGTADGTSTTTAAAGLQLAASGTADGASTTSAAATASRSGAGAAAGTASTGGAAALVAGGDGAADGAAVTTAAGGLSAAGAGAADGVAVTTGAATVDAGSGGAGAADGSGATTGAAGLVAAGAGAADGVSTTAATPGLTAAAAGSAAGAATATAEATVVSVPAEGSAAGASTTTATVGVVAAGAGAADGVAVANAAAFVEGSYVNAFSSGNSGVSSSQSASTSASSQGASTSTSSQGASSVG